MARSLTFVIPAFNEEALIEWCIRSIQLEALGHIHEIIVVDNESTDSTAEVARLAGAVVITEAQKGVTRARQAGLVAAKYGLVAFIDADNELPVGWLEYALIAMDKPRMVAASGPVVYHELHLPKRLVSFVFYCLARAVHQVFPLLQGGNFILDKAAMLQAGGFATNIEFYGEDTETAVRLSRIGKVSFDFNMWVWSSARRIQHEGMFVTGYRYIANYIAIWLTGKPWTTQHVNIRPK